VRDAFAENFARHGEVGSAVAVTVDGKPVVDLWAGHADAAGTRPWTRDKIVNVALTTKAGPGRHPLRPAAFAPLWSCLLRGLPAIRARRCDSRARNQPVPAPPAASRLS